MPPSSTRRAGLRNRRDPDPQHSDAETPDSMATPTRKRRRLNGDRAAAAAPAAEELPPRTRVTESVASNDSNVTLPNGVDAEGPSDPVERQNLVITGLRTPSNYTPNAALDFANDLQARRTQGTNIAAFAKIAARDWCFFVKKTILIIGRADSSLRPNPLTAGTQEVAALPQDDDPATKWGVDIDLGPERQVSRCHAQIDFDSTDQTWYISVNSRNGLKLDDMTLHRGDRQPLHSGICIGIMGTQMLFLLANTQDKFHSMLWRQLKNDHEAEDSDKEGGPPSRSLPHAHPGGPTPKREPYNPFPPPSYPRNHQSSGGYNDQLTSTPGRPHPDTPLAFRSTEKDVRGMGSPSGYNRGIMMESLEEVDYSIDAARDIKPPHSYAQLIGQAILSSPEEMLTLANIYNYIKERYAFFRYTNGGWQNSIRHNLSLSKVFEKVARRTDEPGKGMKWKIADSEREEFLKKSLVHPRKAMRMDSSGPNSPALRDAPTYATERLAGVMNHHSDVFAKHDAAAARVKSPPRSTTPPMTAIPSANEAFTPDRGSQPQHPYRNIKGSPIHGEHSNLQTPAKRLFQESNHGISAADALSSNSRLAQPDSSPTADDAKPKMAGLRGNVANSPPTLYSDTPANNANGAQGARPNNAGLVTPMVQRQAPHLAPPSTAQVPSHFMHFSSPAPFWKYVDIPSTPNRAPNIDLSPIKMKREDDGEKDAEDEPAQPSSPPIIDAEKSIDPEDEEDEEEDDVGKGDDDDDLGPESPSRTVSRPVSRREIPGSQRSRSQSDANGFTAGMASGMVRGASLGSVDEDAEEEGFDLAKGFQKIGTFHRSMAAQSLGVMPRPSQPSDARTSVPTNI
ncbi:hypothetical protein EJ04DRAFT_541167 [Polyplosphaeria fusca]|uniref:Uncharacterized protein n=1 Tax=Polyplosphaeria fusca TaxID=682080 RepID=A0A9P4V7T3_9PLEO|nr:hypothetical protein EJ04DRAFT_541167 [Polyplosphaeria fusca]